MTARKRVADLRVGDMTQHAGGSCTCADKSAPFRVEKLDRWENGSGIDVTWAHLPCGVTCRPCPCSPDCLVEYFGRQDVTGRRRKLEGRNCDVPHHVADR